MSISTAELTKHPLSYRPKSQDASEPVIYHGMLSDVSISGKKIKETVKTQALILYSRKKAKLDEDKRKTLLKRLIERLEKIRGYLNRRKYKKLAYTWEQIHKAQSKYAAVKELVDVQLTGADGKLSMSFSVSAEKLANAKEKDGRYVLVTNRELTADQMLRHFKEQDKIEKRNMTIKGPIRIRPIFLQKQERIEALIFICMLALLAFSILEMLAKRASINMTGRRLMEQFQTLTAVYTRFRDGSILRKVIPLTDVQSKFLSDLDFPTPEVYLKRIQSD
jgi:transposase